MVEKRNCSFCGETIEPGTGKMYIRKDGTIYYFCSNKCKKNRIDLGRVPRRTRWTVRYSELKASTLSRTRGPEKEAPKEPKIEKPKKTGERPKSKRKLVQKPSKPKPEPVKEDEKTPTEPTETAPVEEAPET